MFGIVYKNVGWGVEGAKKIANPGIDIILLKLSKILTLYKVHDEFYVSK